MAKNLLQLTIKILLIVLILRPHLDPLASPACHYEGRAYGEGESIPHNDPCRQCKCIRNGKSRRIMLYMDCIHVKCPEPETKVFGLKPEPNCHFEYKNGECCGRQVCPNTSLRPDLDPRVNPNEDQTKPQIQLQTYCQERCLDSKYLKHYYERSCRPLLDTECGCPVAFDCPQLSRNPNVCEYEGRAYGVGDRIPIHNPCRECNCRDTGRTIGQVEAEIDCGIGIECDEDFVPNRDPNCYYAYKKGECCGHKVCTNNTSPADKVCNYKGRQYRRGEQIHPDEDKCKTCYCDDHWDDARQLDSPSCHLHKCELQLDSSLRKGCLPIYHEGTCCPLDYKCPKNVWPSGQSYQSPSDVSQCWFDGRGYPIGALMPSDNVCVECQCRTPPDMTCIQRSCPSPPANCHRGKWDKSVCCPQIICPSSGNTLGKSV